VADSVSINGGKSAAEVAHALLIAVGEIEGKYSMNSWIQTDRAWLLDTYAECHTAARGHRRPRGGSLDNV
jgi:hypothetical protein